VNEVQPTTRQQQEYEVRQAMQGVGAYVNPTTGNTYYRGTTGPRATTGTPEVIDSRQRQPPMTQPDQ